MIAIIIIENTEHFTRIHLRQSDLDLSDFEKERNQYECIEYLCEVANQYECIEYLCEVANQYECIEYLCEVATRCSD